MNEAQLNPFASGILIPAYLDAAEYSSAFTDKHGAPPSSATKVHHMRSVVQIWVGNTDRYELDPAYMELGHVQFTDLATGNEYVRRSHLGVTIERARRGQQTLFDATSYLEADVKMLIFQFHAEGLDMSIASTKRQKGRRRLLAAGTADFIATWPYTTTPSPFDQGVEDPFGELGGMDEFGESI